MENWKPIMGFDSYEVSDLGRVRSVFNGATRVLKLELHKQTGYLRATLSARGTTGKQYHRKVHRLVALAFLENPENKPEVNHKDANKMNCSVGNLEWVTSSENTVHAVSLGRHHLYRKAGRFANIGAGEP